MRILHVTPRLHAPAAAAVECLIQAQQNRAHVVTTLRLEGDEESDAAALASTSPRSFDVIHAHTVRAVLAVQVVLSQEPVRRPLLATLHEWTATEADVRGRIGLEALASTACIGVPAATAAVHLIAQGIDPLRIRVIPYPVEMVPEIDPASEPLLREMVEWRNRGGDVVCAVAHAASGSHHRIVLEALAMLPHRQATLCVLAGDIDAAVCEARARALGIADRVRLCREPAHARHVAARADAVILPGFDERRPFALAEVWCDGVPVLAARNTQFTDLDAHGGGTLFYEPHDPLDLARAMTTVRSTTPAGRRLLVERARALYRLRFTEAAIVDAYDGEYRAALGARQSVA